MEGTCLCGAVTVTINDSELFSRPRGHLCHCLNCRKTASSAFGSNLAIESEKVTIKGAENMNVYADYDTTSGKCVRRHFCKTCGNPIQSIAEAYPGKTILKMGIFEKVMTPEWESFVKDRHPWISGLEGAVQFKAESGGEKV
ncbi:hypothetical protein BCIN_12g06580 [Botrytis cinerea B05.10]|uniref:CENP-V/GFA domain-containing protein n=2 Tax=Botryotinia fuckeliana TaxID=40559 RepID=A0A384K011_BOTFB|nr:hypothetical protein BCIN_12g06580 [Botrytis cinerea B05.10]ATZ56128.1 hypothetical protein BCIN_12g06580 [Botrytis cinerea B05.10]CCD33737.1 similar to glutathione-dependent formaldehyde-activating gfa [Botrytis cinerea T4]